MWKWLQSHWLYAAAIVLIGLCVAGLSFSATYSRSYQDCQTERATKYADNYKPDLSEQIPAFIVCEGESIDANGVLITAVGTLVIALFTATLWLVTNKSLNLARAEFISSHRPKLRLRHFRMELPVLGETVKLQFALSNIGDTAATVAVVEVTLILEGAGLFLDENGEPTKAEDSRTLVTFPTGANIAGGDSVILRGESVSTFEPPHGAPDENWFCRRTKLAGTITYVDDLGVRRRTGFYRWCRELARFEFMDFTKAQKRDWEYED